MPVKKFAYLAVLRLAKLVDTFKVLPNCVAFWVDKVEVTRCSAWERNWGVVGVRHFRSVVKLSFFAGESTTSILVRFLVGEGRWGGRGGEVGMGRVKRGEFVRGDPRVWIRLNLGKSRKYRT